MSEKRDKIMEYLKENGERSTGEIAQYLGVTTGSAFYHLRELRLQGKVKVRKVTLRVWLWSIQKGE